MRIGIYVSHFNLNSIMINDINKGNPGMGGTEYLLLFLSYLLSNQPGFEVHLYCCNNLNTVMSQIKQFHVQDIYEAIITAKENGIDYFIFTPNADKEIYRLIERVKLKSITWVQNRFTSDIAQNIMACNYIKRNVCASREQYDCLIDHDVCDKSIVIKNMVSDPRISTEKDYRQPIVTYMGHLSYFRGFHILAKQWKKILKRVPNAQLYVLGSAALYHDHETLGELGIAKKEYEDYFSKFITDANGMLLDSIHFLGRVGIEKSQIFAKTLVGIVNPLSREMGPLSALEMQICSIPIVSINRYGQLETVIDKHTGLLFNRQKNLWRNVVKLLTDQKCYDEMSRNARNYVMSNYSPNIIIKQWVEMLSSNLEERVDIMMPEQNFHNDYKWLRIINRKLKSHKLLRNIPSVLDYEKFVKYLLKSIKFKGCKS